MPAPCRATVGTSRVVTCTVCPPETPYPGCDASHADINVQIRLEEALSGLRRAYAAISDGRPGDAADVEALWDDATWEWDEALAAAREHNLPDLDSLIEDAGEVY